MAITKPMNRTTIFRCHLVAAAFVLAFIVRSLAFAQSPIAHVPLEDHPLDLSGCKLKPIYADDLSKPEIVVKEQDIIERLPDGAWRRTGEPDPTAQWVAEGTGGCIVRDGKLWVAPTPFDAHGEPMPGKRSHMVVWSKQVLPADFLLAFDVSPCGSTSGLLMVFFCAAGKDGKNLFDPSLPPRRAEYDGYLRGSLVNYSDSYWSRNKIPAGESDTNRLRKNPGAELVAQGQSQTTGPTDVTYHLRILKLGPDITIEVNGKIVNRWTDPGRPLGAGCFGLRSMAGVTKVAYTQFRVWDIACKSR